MNRQPSQPSEHARSLRGWLIPVALAAFMPKCALCLLAYIGLGALLGVGGPELCGETGGAHGHWALAVGLIFASVGTVLLGRFLRSRRHS